MKEMQMTTNRLTIRQIAPEDWQGLQRIAMDFCRSKYVLYDFPLPTGEEEIKALTKKFAESQLFFAVFCKDSDEMIGYVCFHNEDGNYDLGYCFHSAHHGKGYAFESCEAVMGYVAQNHSVKHFTAGTALPNLPSVKLLEKLGFVLQKTEFLSFHKDAHGDDIVFEGGNFVKLF